MAKSVPHLGLVAIGRVQFDMALANQVQDKFVALLNENAFQVTGPSEIVTDLAQAEAAAQELARREIDALLVLQTTFADTTMLMALARELTAPLFIWGPPDEVTHARLRLGTLIGLNLACHTLGLEHRPYGYAYAPLDDAASWAKLRTYAAAGRVVRLLKHARVGIVGQHPAGMETCHLDAAALKERLGVTAREYDLAPVFDQIRAADTQAVEAIYDRLNARLANLGEMEGKSTRLTLAAYSTLKDIGARDGLGGIAVRCWPEFFTQLGCAACGAVSLLNDDQVPATCEADVNGTVSQLVLQWLSGETAFATDIVQADPKADQVILWHCGQAPLSMADPSATPRATLHTNRKMPLLMDFALKPGIVTLARFSRSGGDLKLVIGRGEMLSAPQAYTGTAGVFRPERSTQAFLDVLLGTGLEHHLCLTYGDYVAELETLATLLGLPTQRI